MNTKTHPNMYTLYNTALCYNATLHTCVFAALCYTFAALRYICYATIAQPGGPTNSEYIERPHALLPSLHCLHDNKQYVTH